MPLLLLGFVLLLPLLFVLLLPFSIVQRYRAGTARRLGRPWVASINVMMIALSAVLFLFAAGLMSIWMREAFLYALAGFAIGGTIGILGLRLTRWESTARALHYTPNRLLVLAITAAVVARVAYGFWRGWHAWGDAESAGAWLAAAGAAGSIAVGAFVLGYYLTYWTGVARRVRQHQRANAWHR